MEIVDKVPYDQELQDFYLDKLESDGNITASQRSSLEKKKLSYRATIRRAFLTEPPPVQREGGVKGTLPPPSKRKKEAKVYLKDPVRQFLLEKMNQGTYGQELRDLLSAKFSPDDLQQKQDIVDECLSEEGLLGTIYADPLLFDSCEDMRKHWQRKGLNPRIVILRDRIKNRSCGTCSDDGTCRTTGKPTASLLEYDWDGVGSIVDEMVAEGKIDSSLSDSILSEAPSPKEALQQVILSSLTAPKKVKVGGKQVKLLS